MSLGVALLGIGCRSGNEAPVERSAHRDDADSGRQSPTPRSTPALTVSSPASSADPSQAPTGTTRTDPQPDPSATGGAPSAPANGGAAGRAGDGAAPQPLPTTPTLPSEDPAANDVPAWLETQQANLSPRCSLRAVTGSEFDSCRVQVPVPVEGWEYGCEHVLLFAIAPADASRPGSAVEWAGVSNCDVAPVSQGQPRFLCEADAGGRPSVLELCPDECETTRGETTYVGVGFIRGFIEEAVPIATCQFED